MSPRKKRNEWNAAEEDYRKFKEGLLDASREAFESHLQNLSRQMGIED